MSSGIQEEIAYDKLISELEKRLSNVQTTNHIDESIKKESNQDKISFEVNGDNGIDDGKEVKPSD